MIGDTLNVGLLADEEGKSVGVSSDVWNGTVGADTGVRQSGLHKISDSLSNDLGSYLVAIVG